MSGRLRQGKAVAMLEPTRLVNAYASFLNLDGYKLSRAQVRLWFESEEPKLFKLIGFDMGDVGGGGIHVAWNDPKEATKTWNDAEGADWFAFT